MLNLGNLKLGDEEVTDKTPIRDVLQSVKANLEELHLHENMLKDTHFVSLCLGPIAEMPNLKYLNLARNGTLTKASTVALLAHMADQWAVAES